MGKILVSLLNGVFSFVFKGIVVKFFVFFGLFYITTEFIPLVIEMFIPEELIGNLNTLFNQIPDSIWYFLNIFQFPLGLSLIISSMVARFIIRRLPIIG